MVRGRGQSRVRRVLGLVSVTRHGVGVHVCSDDCTLASGFLALTFQIVRQVRVRGLSAPQLGVEVVGFGLSQLAGAVAVNGIEPNWLLRLLRSLVHERRKTGFEVDGVPIDVPRALRVTELVDMRSFEAQFDLLLILIDHMLTPLSILRVHHVQGCVLLAGDHDACPGDAGVVVASDVDCPVTTHAVVLVPLKCCIAHGVGQRGNAGIIARGDELLDDVRGKVPLLPVAPLRRDLAVFVAHRVFMTPHPVVVLERIDVVVLGQLIDDAVSLSAEISAVVTQVAKARVSRPSAGNVNRRIRLGIFSVDFHHVAREVRARGSKSPGCFAVFRGLGGVVIDLLSQVGE